MRELLNSRSPQIAPKRQLFRGQYSDNKNLEVKNGIFVRRTREFLSAGLHLSEESGFPWIILVGASLNPLEIRSDKRIEFFARI
jgi:hypothetical protein